MPKFYFRNPRIIEAVQWTGENHREMFEFLGGSPNDFITANNDNFRIDHSKVPGGLLIKTGSGEIATYKGEYVTKETIQGKIIYSPCPIDTFELAYVPASEFIVEIEGDTFEVPEKVFKLIFSVSKERDSLRNM